MKILLIMFLVFYQFTLIGQIGLAFPNIRGHLLNDMKVSIPHANGKYSLIAIAYDRDAEEQLKKWLNPLYNVFIKKEKGSTQFDMAELFDVNFVFIPLINGFQKAEESFKKNTDKEFWAYVMDTEKTDIKSVQNELMVKDNKIPYFYLLNPNGIILNIQSGKFSEEKLDIIEDLIE